MGWRWLHLSTSARLTRFSSPFAQLFPLEQISFSSPLALLTLGGRLPILKLRGLARTPWRAEPGWLLTHPPSPPCTLLGANALTCIPSAHLPSILAWVFIQGQLESSSCKHSLPHPGWADTSPGCLSSQIHGIKTLLAREHQGGNRSLTGSHQQATKGPFRGHLMPWCLLEMPGNHATSLSLVPAVFLCFFRLRGRYSTRTLKSLLQSPAQSAATSWDSSKPFQQGAKPTAPGNTPLLGTSSPVARPGREGRSPSIRTRSAAPPDCVWIVIQKVIFYS